MCPSLATPHPVQTLSPSLAGSALGLPAVPPKDCSLGNSQKKNQNEPRTVGLARQSKSILHPSPHRIERNPRAHHTLLLLRYLSPRRPHSQLPQPPPQPANARLKYLSGGHLRCLVERDLTRNVSSPVTNV